MPPRFAVLDVVEIADEPTAARLRSEGRSFVVEHIREYADGPYVYGLAILGDADTAVVGGLFDERSLHPTGDRAAVDVFRLPGPFESRELVDIAADYSERAIAGRVGVVTASVEGDPGGQQVAVWIEELGELFVLPCAAMKSRGERCPPPERGRIATTTRVSASGEVIGEVSYVVVDEIERYL